MAIVTIRDVAKYASVGVGTVSRVMNGSPNVSAATRERVQDAIKALDYRPNPTARRLSLGKTYTIGVIAPFFTNPSVIERVRGIESALVDTDYDFMIFNVENVPRRDQYFESIPRRARIDGLIIVTLIPTDEEVERFASRTIPTVLIDQTHDSLNYIAIDDVEGGRMATQHLIDLGHRKIGLISDYVTAEADPFKFTSSRDRYSGYCQALNAAGIAYQPRYHRQGPHAKKHAYDLARELFEMSDRPTAIFATSDTQAFGVLQAAKEMGVRVPEDVSVIGYDDIEVAQYLNLTTVRQPLFDTGELGAKLLLSHMKKPSSAERTQRKLPVQLVVRQSTSPLHAE